MTKKLLTSLVLACAASLATAYAAPICSDGTTSPDNGALYFNGSYSCQIGDKLFSNFTYTPSGTIPVLAGAVTVNTLGPAGSGASLSNPNIGLQFDAPWSAPAGNSSDAAIGFTVTVLSGASVIEDFGLAQTSGVLPNGSAAVAERGCGPAPCNPVGGVLAVMTFDNGTVTSQTTNEIFTPLLDSVQVEKDIAVVGGTNGFAALSIVQDTFSQVPEPMSMGLLGGGLALLGLARLRLSRKRN